MKFERITVCLDMYGCPNRCRHCWLGVTPNGHMPVQALDRTAELFRPYTDCLQIYDWYREPDFSPQYPALFEKCSQLSDRPVTHFELVSFWRLVRDEAYADWLYSVGVRTAQLTLFGGEETTDAYIGRRGAYREILDAIEILLAHGISPRIQAFVNRTNLGELPHLEQLIRVLDLENRCGAFGGKFSFFLHQGSCDGKTRPGMTAGSRTRILCEFRRHWPNIRSGISGKPGSGMCSDRRNRRCMTA